MGAVLAGADAIVHSAGIAGAMSGCPEDDCRIFNTEATIGLAQAAHRAGVKRFIFLSSIRAQCGPTTGQVLTEDLEARPTDAYGKSKLAAWLRSMSIGSRCGWSAMRGGLERSPRLIPPA